MKRAFFVIAACISLASCASSDRVSARTAPPAPKRSINEFFDVDLNGCPQRVLIQSDDMEKNPILLFLHGGPGSSALIYSHCWAEKLLAHFILVNWDQRGTAFSFHEGMDTSKISEGQILADALELIKYLLRTFHREKLYLVGQSFGSALGISLAAWHPEYLSAYIGTGQIIDFKRSVKITYAWLHDVLAKAGDAEGLKKIETNDVPDPDLIIKYGGHHRLSLDLGAIMRSSPYYFEGYAELFRKSKAFGQEWVAKNPPGFVNLASIEEFKVPLYFFEGVNDHVMACAPELVTEFVERIKAPGKTLVWFADSAHLVNLEEPVRFQDELIKVLKETMK